jgi:hypothetical protein
MVRISPGASTVESGKDDFATAGAEKMKKKN